MDKIIRIVDDGVYHTLYNGMISNTSDDTLSIVIAAGIHVKIMHLFDNSFVILKNKNFKIFIYLEQNAHLQYECQYDIEKSDLIMIHYDIISDSLSHGNFIFNMNVKSNLDFVATIRMDGNDATVIIKNLISVLPYVRCIFRTNQYHSVSNSHTNSMTRAVIYEYGLFDYFGSIKINTLLSNVTAYQCNKNLLVDKTAHAFSKPYLDILSYQVKCSHGAAMSTILPIHIWYLESRGIIINQARKILIDGFLSTVN